jgi:hypothetical protein
MKIIINTQVHENYGAHDWDGKGECPQYWKAKPGCDYVIENISMDDVLAADNASNYLRGIIDQYRSKFENDSEYYQEYLIDWNLEEDDFLTQYEQEQLEFYGKISYPPQVLNKTRFPCLS